MTSYGTSTLQLPLPPTACHVTHFKDIKRDLLSIGQLCDADCTSIYNKNEFLLYKNGQVILRGPRNQSTRLWDVDLQLQTNPQPSPTPTNHTCNHAWSQQSTAATVKFLHAACGHPSISTLLSAIKTTILQCGHLSPNRTSGGTSRNQ